MALVVVLSLVLLPGNAPGVGAQGLGDRISEARQRQAALQRAIDRQKQLLADLKADQSIAQSALGTTARSLDGINADQASLRKEIQEAQDAIDNVQARRDSLADELRQLDWTLQLLEQEIADGDQELDERRRLLGTRLAEAYRSQNTSLLEQVLADQSFSDVLTAANAYLSYGDQDAQMAQDIACRPARARLAARPDHGHPLPHRPAAPGRPGCRGRAARPEVPPGPRPRAAQGPRGPDPHDPRRAAVGLPQDRRQRPQAGRARGRQGQGRAEAGQQDRRRSSRRRSGVLPQPRPRPRRQQNNGGGGGGGGGGGLGEGNGSFSWPTYGLVTQEFGCTGFPLEPPRGSCAHFHDGIDIANGEGTPLRAPADGVIAFVGWNPYDGSDPSYMLVMGHAGGLESRFMHLQSRAVVRAGQSVKKGQLIGYMGNTGNSTGAHLHWEIYRGNTPINPRGLV